MDEDDASAPTSDPWLGVDESGTGLDQVGQSRLDRDDGICDVMQTLTMLGQESTHRGFRSQRLEQLDERPSHLDHRLLDPLALHLLPVDGLDPVSAPITLDGLVEVMDRDRHVVEIDQLHRGKGNRGGEGLARRFSPGDR